MKAQRHAAILAIVRGHRVASQEALRRLLQDQGFEVTQATLSRDIRELGLVKLTDPERGAHYSAPPAAATPGPPVEQVVDTLLLSAEGVGPFLVIKTPAGSANTLASAIDRARWSEVLGTIAGDDTILLITRSETARRRVGARLRGG